MVHRKRPTSPALPGAARARVLHPPRGDARGAGHSPVEYAGARKASRETGRRREGDRGATVRGLGVGRRKGMENAPQSEANMLGGLAVGFFRGFCGLIYTLIYIL